MWKRILTFALAVVIVFTNTMTAVASPIENSVNTEVQTNILEDKSLDVETKEENETQGEITLPIEETTEENTTETEREIESTFESEEVVEETSEDPMLTSDEGETEDVSSDIFETLEETTTEANEYIQPQRIMFAMERIESVASYSNDEISQEAINTLFFEHPEYLVNDDFDDVIAETVKYSLEVQNEVNNEKFAAYFEALHQGTSILWNEFWSLFGIGDSYQDKHEKEMAKEILQKYSENNNSFMTSTNEVKEAIGTISRVYDITLASERELFAQELKSKNLTMSDEKIDKLVKDAFAETEYLTTMKKVAGEAIGTFVISMEYIELMELEERAINDLIAICEQSGCENVETQLRKIKEDRDTDFWTYFSKYYLTEHTIDLLWGKLKDWVKENVNVTKIDMKDISSAQKVAELMLEVVSQVYSDYNPNVDEITFSAMALSYFNSAEIVLNNYERKFSLAKNGKATVTAEDIRMYEAAYSYQLAATQILAKYSWKMAYKQDQSSQLHFDILCAKNAVDKFSYSKYLKSCLKNMEADNIEIPELPEDYDSTESIAAKFDAIRNQYVPNVSYWTGSWGGCIQCFGFARMVFSKLFGCEMPSAYYGNRRYELVPGDNVVLIGQLVGSNVNTTNVKNLLTQGKLGDVIQANGVYGQHTMILEGTSDAGVTVYQCNKSGECGVYEDTYSWDTFVYLYGSASNGSDNGISLYRAHNYASIYGDGTNLFYDDTLNFVIDANGVLTKYNGWQKFVKIPDTVTAIGDEAFKNNTSMLSVSIPEGVTSIGDSAFYGCSNLLGVYIPNSVSVIGESAFYRCRNMAEVRLPENKYFTALEKNVFYECSSLENIVFPDTITFMGLYAFYGCSGLKEIVLPNSLDSIKFGCFAECISANKIYIPSSLQTVSSVVSGAYIHSVFEGCTSVKTIEFGEGITIIPNDLFERCTWLSEIVIPETVTEIGNNAFSKCSNLRNITLPNSLRAIGSGAFSECTMLEKVDFPDSLEQIGSSAFADCVSLTEIILPNKLTTITESAFARCSSVEKIYIPKSLNSIKTVVSGGYVYSVFEGCTSVSTVEFEEGIKIIPARLFEDCEWVENIILPNTLDTIEQEAFARCANLKEITIPDTVTNMGTNIFYNCTSLERVHLPNIRQNLPAYTFYNCTSLKEVNLPDTLVSVQNYAFYNCDALQTVDLPNGVTSIGQYAFYDCDALTRVNMKDAITTIGNYAFNGCDSLKNVTLSAGLTTIPQYGFANCGNLEEIVLPYKMTTISANAFVNDVKLAKITIPRNVTSIASNVFSYPANMTIYGVAGTYAETYANANNITFVNQEIHATAIEVLPENPTVNKGYTKQMTLSVTPSNFTDEIVWKSSNTSIATVDQNGLVKGVGVGTTKIKVSVGEVSKQFTITVLQPVTSIYISPWSVDLEAGQEVQLSAEVYPDDASNKEYEWSSEDETIATVDSFGIVTGVSKGTVKIYATAKDGSEVYDYCNVTVTSNLYVVDSVEGFESKHPYENYCEDVWKYQDNEAKKIVIRFAEETEVEEDFDYIYIYGDNNVQIGKYTGTQLAGKEIAVPGTSVRVKLVSDNAGAAYGFKVDEIRVVGAEKPLEAIVLSETELVLTKDEQKQLTVSYIPENTTDNRDVTWSSSDVSIVKVDDTGMVKAIGVGTAIIQAKVGQKIAECKVDVVIPLETIEFEESEVELAVGERYTVRVKYNPTDTTVNRQLLWNSSNTSVATVNDNGAVLVVGYGEAVIEGVSVINESIKDTCVIKVNQYEVQFDSMGGSPIEPIMCGYNQPLDCSIIISERENYVLVGWYKDSNYQEEWTSTDVVTDNIILYAKWQEIKEGLWLMPLEDQSYTGQAIKPLVRIYDNDVWLREKIDYTITYKNNVKANNASNEKTAPTIVIKGKGNYSDVITAYFTILPKNFADEDILSQNLTTKYNGRIQKKIPTVTWNGKKLRNKLDYTVEYPDMEENANAYKEPGDYNILIKGIGNYTGEKLITITITENELISKAYVTKIADQMYTGNAIEPVLSVRHGLNALKLGVDYSVEYKDNVNVGTATATITGIGTYSGTKKVTFKIIGTSIASAKITGMPSSFVYSGSVITTDSDVWEEGPVLTVLVGKDEYTLVEGADYDISYRSNTDKGTAIVQFIGKGAYTGKLTKTFRILAYDIAKDESEQMTLYLKMDSYEYEKGGNRPKPVVMFGNTVLTEKKDYTLSYRNNYKVNDGSNVAKAPIVIIKGKGNFSGSKELSFAITSNDLSDLIMSAEDKVFLDREDVHESEPVIVTQDGQKLKKGQDYEDTLTYCYKEETALEDGTVREAGALVEADDIVPVGTTLEVIAIGKGNYEGLIKSEYRIVKYDISKASITIPKRDYTGKAITLDKSEITVKLGDTVLNAEDYEIVTYQDNIDRGRAKVTIRGVGDYGGTRTAKFTIKSKLLEWWEGVLNYLFG